MGCVANLRFGLRLVADPLLWVCAWGQPATDPVAPSPRSFLSAPRQLGAYQGARPPGVSGVGPRPLIGVRTHWGSFGLAPRQPGCLSHVHSPGAEGGGAPEAVTAGESSLTSC